MFIKAAPYHHDYSWLPLIWGIGHIQPVKAALINCRLFSRHWKLSPTAAKETAGRLPVGSLMVSLHVFRTISSRCDDVICWLLSLKPCCAKKEALLCWHCANNEPWHQECGMMQPVWTNVLGSRQARNRQQQATNLQPNLWFGNFSGWLDWICLANH